MALIEALQGKKDIQEFADDVKNDSWGGLSGPNVTVTEISVYLDGLEKDKKKDENKKDDKKKDAKDKKEEKKDETPPALKKDKPFVQIFIGTVDKGKKIAHVKRVLQDDTKSYFTWSPRRTSSGSTSSRGALVFISTRPFPGPSVFEVVAVDLRAAARRRLTWTAAST